jgi:hypothetical protein
LTYSITKTFKDEVEYLEHTRMERATELSDCVLTKLKNDLRQITKYCNTNLHLYPQLKDQGFDQEQIASICNTLGEYLFTQEMEFLQDSVEIR